MSLGPTILLALTTLTAPAGADDAFDELPLAFVENRGQWDARVRYEVRRAGMTAFLVDDGLRLQLSRTDREDDRVVGVNLFLTFEGASPDVRTVGREPLPGRRSYFIGDDPARWAGDVPAYAAVRYEGLRPGVDLGVREHRGRLEYDVLLAPGADPARVVVRCDGIERLEVEPDGSLAMHTALGPVRQSPPVTWQVLPTGERRPVRCRFRLLDERRYGFEVDGLDPDLGVVIDPGLEWSTFLGGTGNDFAAHFVQDDAGLVTVTGTTASSNFPTTAGAFDTTFNSSFGIPDAFVARFDPSQTGAAQLVWSTFVGGTGEDRPNSITLGPGGEVVVGGRTISVNFPTTPGAYAATKMGNRDGFVFRLDPTGSALTYGTYLGGSAREHIIPAAVDGAGVITVAGWTLSSDFPVTDGSTWKGGASFGDVFVSQLDPSQSGTAQLVFSTLHGGTGDEWPRNVALTAAGAAVVSGTTSSTDLPTTVGAFDPIHNGGTNDGFVASVDPATGLLLWSTFLGGSGLDQINAMVVDAAGRPTMGGWTASSDFPTSVGAYDASFNGGCAPDPTPYDAFVARLDPTGSTLTYGTFLGGTCDEGINGLAVDAGIVTVTGSVASFDFPTTVGAYDTSFNGGGGADGPFDAYVARLDPGRSGVDQLLYATYLGGAANYDYGFYYVAVDATGGATVAGPTRSANFPTTVGAYDTTHNGNEDAFVTRLDMLPVGADEHGFSTPGCDGPLAVGVTGTPQIGNASFGLTCTHAPANAAGFLFLGVGCVASPVYGSGAALFFDVNNPFLQLGVASDGEGVSRVPAPLPNDSTLVGLGACIQFAWPDPCAPGGYSASNALAITVQP